MQKWDLVRRKLIRMAGATINSALAFSLAAFMLLCGATSISPQVGYPQELALQAGKEDGALRSCSYVVKIKTSCSFFAGTDDRISLAFGDAYGNQVYLPTLNDPSGDSFERCSTDTFSIVGPCIYKPCYLYLFRTGSDAWKPDWVKVLYGQSRSVTFYYDTSIPEGVWYGFNLCGSLSNQTALSM